MKEPTVEQVEKKQNVVNEESFYEPKGNILEIQPYIFKKKHISTEEESEEEESKPSKQEEFYPGQLDFESIGYKNYEGSRPRYVVVKNSEPLKHNCQKCQQKHRHHHKKDASCDCYKDLVVDQSSISEQSMSYESQNEQQFGGRVST